LSSRMEQGLENWRANPSLGAFASASAATPAPCCFSCTRNCCPATGSQSRQQAHISTLGKLHHDGQVLGREEHLLLRQTSRGSGVVGAWEARDSRPLQSGQVLSTASWLHLAASCRSSRTLEDKGKVPPPALQQVFALAMRCPAPTRAACDIPTTAQQASCAPCQAALSMPCVSCQSLACLEVNDERVLQAAMVHHLPHHIPPVLLDLQRCIADRSIVEHERRQWEGLVCPAATFHSGCKA